MGDVIRIPEFVIGVDEVGMGALAGPIIVCGFAAPVGWKGVAGLGDSKTLSHKQKQQVRSRLWGLVVKKEVYCRIENWSHEDIDRMGVANAHRLAIRNVIVDLAKRLNLALVVDVIVDGNLNFSGIHPKVRSVIKADSKFPTVSAASIIAKAHRDDQMPSLDVGDVYGFAQHMGYPTPAHKAALTKHGPGPYHRMSYAPVKEASRG